MEGDLTVFTLDLLGIKILYSFYPRPSGVETHRRTQDGNGDGNGDEDITGTRIGYDRGGRERGEEAQEIAK